MKVEILGIPIDAITAEEAVRRVSDFLTADSGGKKLFTPNPEMLVMARRDPKFAVILRQADLAIPDGAGLLWAANRQGTPIPERVTGTDLMLEICALASRTGKSVFLLGAGEGVAASAAAALRSRYPGIKLVGAESGGNVRRDASGHLVIDEDALSRVREASPDIVFVAFGHGKQEQWITENLPALPSVKLAAGIGGAFDFLAGKVKRAPASWRAAGIEWLWRLITEPRRLKRIIDAVVVFPWLVISSTG